jgi:phage terminase large subunit
LTSSVRSQATQTILRWRANPLAFATEALRATPEPWQVDALTQWANRPRLSIRSGHGVGKSTLLSWLLLHNQVTKFPAKCGTTAPSEHQLEDILWAEVATWFRRLPEAVQAEFRLTHLRLELRGAEEESFAAGRVSRPETPEAFAGYHSPNMLLLGDEASGIAEPIFEVGIGAMSTPNARMALASNPTRPNGFFFETHHRLRDRWATIRVNSEDVPRATGHIADVIAVYGKDSNVYRVRVLGDFPTSEDDSVIPLHLCEAAIARDVQPSDAYRTVWGVDVARFGDDRTALAKRKGNVLLEPVKSWRGKDTMQTSGLLMDEWNETHKPDRPSEIIVDVIGMGAGVVDRLRELGLPVRGLNVAEQASAAERYMRLRDELWFRARNWLAGLDVKIPKDDALIAELVAPKYAVSSSGKVQVERKEEMKRRGLSSPDLADAFIHTFAGGIDKSDERGFYDRYARKSRGASSAWAA